MYSNKTYPRSVLFSRLNDIPCDCDSNTSENHEKQQSYNQPHNQLQKEIIEIFGEINEEKAANVVFSLLYLKEKNEDSFHQLVEEELDEESGKITTVHQLTNVKKPIEVYINTEGGDAASMFAIYDTIKFLQKEGFQVHTYALGKVMSAGILLFAAGSVGHR